MKDWEFRTGVQLPESYKDIGWENVRLASSAFYARALCHVSLRRAAAVVATLLAISIGPSAPAAVQATDDAEASQKPPVVMPMFLTSKSDDCYDSGLVTAIKRIATLSQKYINRTGGIAGRQLVINLLDDNRDPCG